MGDSLITVEFTPEEYRKMIKAEVMNEMLLDVIFNTAGKSYCETSLRLDDSAISTVLRMIAPERFTERLKELAEK